MRNSGIKKVEYCRWARKPCVPMADIYDLIEPSFIPEIERLWDKLLATQRRGNNGAEIGTVFADNVDDPESLDSIRFGMINGEGLLGAALEAGLKLAELEGEAGYWGENITKEMSEALKQQRVVFYNSLKAIERLES